MCRCVCYQTSFEFRKGKAFPVISGVVVATENEETVREVRATHLISISPDPDPVVQAYWEAEHVAAQKEQDKRHQAVIKRWTKLVHGLRIRQRMREQYGTAPTVPDHPPVDDSDGADQDELHGAGGFLTGAGDVVQPYNLPRPTHVVFSSPPRSPAPDDNRTPPPTLVPEPEPEFEPALLDDEDEDDATAPRDSDLDSDVRSAEELQANGNGNSENRGMPKSMAELAAEAEAAAMAQMSTEPNENADVLSVAPSRRRAAVLPKANGEVKAERGRGRKRVRAHDSGSEDEDEWQSDDGDEVDEDGGRGTRNAKRPRPRARRVQRSALAVPVPTSDRVLRARKK